MSFTVLVRVTGRVEKHPCDTLVEALDRLESELRACATTSRSAPVRVLGREYEPVSQVVARGELRGKGRLHAGVDVRGDGSTEAWTGRLRKHLVAPQGREDAFQALRRTLLAR
ncbi:hypothetical protein [Paraconexibacter sp.]|uniref:hypothetical protein n=1 Tax=Paraconexibacter sp. TaxID=2949640 RepID=UPI003568F27A